MLPETYIPYLLLAALLLPLVGFVIELLGAKYWQQDRKNKTPAYIAVACIVGAFGFSVAAFVAWGQDGGWDAFASHENEHHAADDGEEHHKGDEQKENGEGEEEAGHDSEETKHSSPKIPVYWGLFYTLGSFGDLTIGLEYYIDSLTLAMFMMVTLIASCIHVFAIGYMSDELTDDHEDHEVHLPSGKHFHRPGRFYRFFAYLSLFSFSMLGIVLSGSILMVFIFWELVGVSSYLLIGFYIERKTASDAANKAFIMNRVGDFGFLIGLMVIWTYFGTFSFNGLPGEDSSHNLSLYSQSKVDQQENAEEESGSDEDSEHEQSSEPGLFNRVWDHDGNVDVETTESGLAVVHLQGGLALDSHEEQGHHKKQEEIAEHKTEKSQPIPYWLLVVAGLGVFGGCVGKSAQFPLQTWLPDAMEGPTPVSALVHSATMVAAGVYLTARFSPMFLPEVLLVIAYVGCITLFLGATIAIVATDIKRVLAYSTISQLGYMMLALGLAGWGAGLYHLFTHAFFKSLMFLCAGSVIVGCHHVQEMPRMGGLLKKMPITAITMLIGVIAICGLAIPGIHLPWVGAVSFSGYHSKDAIVATSLAYSNHNPIHLLLFIVPLITAGITAFYMFRLWFYTFWGEPRDKELYNHAHESPWVMTGPLIVLAVFAAFCAVGGEHNGPLFNGIVGSEPAHIGKKLLEDKGIAGTGITLPDHGAVGDVHGEAGVYALIVAFAGAILAYLVYGAKLVNPAEIKKQFSGVHNFLVEKWHFDELYDAMFVNPAHIVGGWISAIDRICLDGILHWLANACVKIARWDRWFDERAVDGLVNVVGEKTYSLGTWVRGAQTGNLRGYILSILIAVGALAVIVPIIALLS